MESQKESMMDEALRILQEEGFSLPDDVKETLSSFSHHNEDDRHSSAPGSRTRSTDVHSKSTKIHSTERSDSSNLNLEPRSQDMASNGSQSQFASRYRVNNDRNVGSSYSDPGWGHSRNSRSDSSSAQNGTDTESSCSASTVREARSFGNTRQNSQTSRHESVSSVDSTMSETKLKDVSGEAAACGDKTIDDVLHTHEAKTDNMKNITRDMGNKMSENMRKGIGREISTDSGIADLVSSTQPGSPVSESSTYGTIAVPESALRSNVNATAKRDSTSTFQDGHSQKTIKRDDNSVESTDVENASKGIFMTKAEQACGKIDGVDTVESHQSSSSALTATGTASKLRTEVKDGQMTTQAEFEGDSRLARQESSQSTIETDHAKLTKEEDMKQEQQSKITETSYTTQGRRGSGGSLASTISTSKQENSKKESINKSVNESKVSPDGSVSQLSKTEDSNTMTSSFSGKSSKQETIGGKTYTRTISNENSSESNVKNVSESKTYSSVSSDGTLVDENQGVRPELSAGENFSHTYDLGIDGLDSYNPYARRNSGSSEMSRQDSTASSIASSASAMYEREQKKKREQEAAERNKRRLEDHRGSIDSITKAKQVVNSKYNRNDSDSLLYQNKVRSSAPRTTDARQREPIYQNVPRSESIFSSVSDDVFIEERPVSRQRDHTDNRLKTRDKKYDRNSEDFRNRRSTLQGDIILTEREVYKARDEIRPVPGGRDDSFISSHNESYYSSKDRIPEFDERKRSKIFMDGDVIEREIVSETLSDEEFLFGPEEEIFGSTDGLFGKFRSKTGKFGSRLDADDFFEHGSLFSRKPKTRSSNPYTTRDDLSKLSSRESLNDPKSYKRSNTDFDAMSDSALRSSAQARNLGSNTKSRYGYSETDFDENISVKSMPQHSEARSRGAYEQMNQRLNVVPDVSKSYVQDYVNRNSAPVNGSSVSRLQANSSYPSLGVVPDENRSDYDFKMSSDSGLFSSATASDSIFSAGKSINRNEDRSIKQNNRNYSSSNKPFSDKNLISDTSNRSRRYPNDRFYDEIDMHNDENTCMSTARESSRYRERDNVHTGALENIRGQDKRDSRRQDKKSKGEEKEEWDNRRERIDKALSWIRSELGSLRTQDKVLTSQFQRCQDSIEQLKKQKPWFDVFSDDEDDDAHWEEWEIDEFDRECQRERRQKEQQPRRPEAILSEFERVSIEERDY